MKAEKVLEYINNGDIETLRKLIEEEIYTESLKGNGDRKKRYAAMKKYLKVVIQNREDFLKPGNIEYHGDKYNCFINGYSIVVTKEDIGEIEPYKGDNYFKVGQMLDGEFCDKDTVNLDEVIAKAKSMGYKNKKSEIDGSDFQYVLKYKNGYYKIGLLDLSYSIINDGEKATVEYAKAKAPLRITTSVGMCLVLPVNASDDIETKKNIITIE